MFKCFPYSRIRNMRPLFFLLGLLICRFLFFLWFIFHQYNRSDVNFMKDNNIEIKDKMRVRVFSVYCTVYGFNIHNHVSFFFQFCFLQIVNEEVLLAVPNEKDPWIKQENNILAIYATASWTTKLTDLCLVWFSLVQT